MSDPDSNRSRDFARSIEAVTPLMDWVEDFASVCGLDGEGTHDLMLVVEELFTNHVRHQAGSDVPLRVELGRKAEGAIVLELVDRAATEFDPRDVRDPRLDQPAHERRSGGLGLFLVQRLARRFDYTFRDGVATTRVELGPRDGSEEETC